MKTIELDENEISKAPEENVLKPPVEEGPKMSLREYLMTIVYMPHSMRMVCLTNLFCWMAHVCYSLYFTDFVGEAVYGGNPKASQRPSNFCKIDSF